MSEHHTFNEVLLLPSDVSQLSGAVHEYLDKREDPDSGKELNVLPSLKYFFPAIPKPNEKPKPLTNDQKVQNSIFNRECKKLWLEAKKELDARVALTLSPGSRRSAVEEEKGGKEDEEKSEFRGKLEDQRSAAPTAPRSLSRILHDLSIKVLKEWIEEDEDRLLQRRKQETEEKLTSAKKSHEQFVRIKDRCVMTILPIAIFIC